MKIKLGELGLILNLRGKIVPSTLTAYGKDSLTKPLQKKLFIG